MMESDPYDVWRCGWCEGYGVTTERTLEPRALVAVGEHVTMWCDACLARWPWPDSDWRRQYRGSPFRLVRHPWTDTNLHER